MKKIILLLFTVAASMLLVQPVYAVVKDNVSASNISYEEVSVSKSISCYVSNQHGDHASYSNSRTYTYDELGIDYVVSYSQSHNSDNYSVKYSNANRTASLSMSGSSGGGSFKLSCTFKGLKFE